MKLLISNKTILKHLSKNWFIALVLTLPFLFFLPRAEKYRTTYKIAEGNKQDIIFYEDLDNDGNSERIELRNYGKLKNISSIFIGKNDKFYYEWISTGKRVKGNSCLVGDYDNNNYKEIYMFTWQHDSVFLNGIDPINKKVFIRKKFVTRFNIYKNNNEISITQSMMTDLNGDGFKDIFFTVYSGFACTNRKMGAYDIHNDTLIFSPATATVLVNNIYTFDGDQDSLPEFTGTMLVWGNCTNHNYPYTDSIAWLMVLDNDLSFLFDPVMLGTYSSEVDVVPFRYGKILSLAVLYKQNGVYDSSYIALYTPTGKLIRKRFITVPNQNRMHLFSDPNHHYRELYLCRNKIQQIDSNLQPVRTVLPFYTFPDRIMDIDGDGKNEYIMLDKRNYRFTIFRDNFKKPAVIDIPVKNGNSFFSIYRSHGKANKLFMCYNPYNYWIYYSSNPWHYFKWIFFLLIYTGIYLIIFATGKIQHARLQQRYNDEKRITELQLKAIKNQIDPHFTLNMVSTIGSLFLRKEKEQAYEMFTRYARMLQTTINSSDNISITLQEEIEYVRNYLAIQQFRMENKFTFSITTDKTVNADKIHIPRMLIYTFLENAVKHGIAPLKDNGKINIDISRDKDHVIIHVIDNGIGRKKAKEHPAFGTGKGLKIQNEIIDLFYKIEKTRISYDINDGKESGTVVTIRIYQ